MTPIKQLRLANLLEGISLIVLVFIAVPLKHFAGLPVAVRIVGPVHGLLFLVFVAILFRVAMDQRWPVGRSLAVLATAFVPFGAFFLDRVMPHAVSTTRGDDP